MNNWLIKIIYKINAENSEKIIKLTPILIISVQIKIKRIIKIIKKIRNF